MNENTEAPRNLEAEVATLDRRVKLLERKNRKLRREADELRTAKFLLHGEVVRLRRLVEAEHGGH